MPLSEENNKFIPAFIIAYSNSDFTNPHEMVLPGEPEDCRNDYTHMGVKYSGMETCRHANITCLPEEQCFEFRPNKKNWVKIGFIKRAEIEEIKISTKYFTGNQVPAVSVFLQDEILGHNKKVLNKVSLKPDYDHVFSITPTIATECLVELYCEGGISRIQFFGKKEKQQLPEKINLLEKAKISHVSNEHYGNPKMAVMGNRKEMHMVGWESARTGFGEQAIFHFQKPIVVEEIIVDTYLHRLNAPLSCHVFGINLAKENNLEKILESRPKWMLEFESGEKTVPDDFQSYMIAEKYLTEKVSNPDSFKIKLYLPEKSLWQPLLTFALLRPDTFHRFSKFENTSQFTHLLYMHYPNGGVHGLKVYGR